MNTVCKGTGHSQVSMGWTNCKEMYMRAWYVLYSTDEGKLNPTFPVHFLIQFFSGNLFILPVCVCWYVSGHAFLNMCAYVCVNECA